MRLPEKVIQPDTLRGTPEPPVELETEIEVDEVEASARSPETTNCELAMTRDAVTLTLPLTRTLAPVELMRSGVTIAVASEVNVQAPPTQTKLTEG